MTPPPVARRGGQADARADVRADVRVDDAAGRSVSLGLEDALGASQTHGRRVTTRRRGRYEGDAMSFCTVMCMDPCSMTIHEKGARAYSIVAPSPAPPRERGDSLLSDCSGSSCSS
jgi:hypothetical protein